MITTTMNDILRDLINWPSTGHLYGALDARSDADLGRIAAESENPDARQAAVDILALRRVTTNEHADRFGDSHKDAAR